MNISDADAAHWAKYALDGTCDHEHVVACECCTRPSNFFGKPFASFINDIVLNQQNDYQL